MSAGNGSNGRTQYWRSLRQISDTPSYGQAAAHEFPEGASEPPEGISRRDVLVLLGASLSMAGLTACRRPVDKIVPYVNAPEEIVPGVPMQYATTMPFGTSAYGLVVESHEGRPAKIEGNTLHPSTQGSSNAWVQAATYGLYDPDRSRTPLRAGEASTWEEFLSAWGEIAQIHDGDAGAGLAILSESFSSPTLGRLNDQLRERFPRRRWAVYEPVSDENVLEGIGLVSGRPLQPIHHFERAEVILSIDSDFLVNDPESIRHGRGFADGRRLAAPGDTMNRLYAVESAFSATGAAADHRKALPSGRMGTFTAALAGALAARGLPLDLSGSAPGADEVGIDASWLSALAGDLLEHAGRGVIVAGAHLPAEVHAAVAVLNAALGNLGVTVTFHEPLNAVGSRRVGLAALARAMRDGTIRTLVILGGNPAYNAPADFDFASAMAEVEHTIHLSEQVNETSALAEWHLPRAHFLESWGDARAMGGPLSVIQPLIEPLFDGHSDMELVSLMATSEERSGHDLVRETWVRIFSGQTFDREWNRVLHDGVMIGSAAPPVTPEIGTRIRVSDLASPAANGLEIRFVPSYAVHDGRFANVGWLQELPDPATKLTWDNAALLAPATARELSVSNGDVVRLQYRDRSLELPAFVMPGQAAGTVVVALGYGRTAAGNVGNGVGVDAYVLRHSDAPDFDGGARLEKTGATYRLAGTQDHWVVDELGIEERQRRVGSLVRSGTLEEYRADPEFAAKYDPPHPPLESLWHEHGYDEGFQWGMTIDLNTCIGCNACVIACQSENNIPVVGKEQVTHGREMQWLRIDRYFSGSVDEPEEMLFQPVACMHCENAPCEQVCPVAATVHDGEGLNTMVYNRCIGTRYCSNNCPYKVRRFNFFNYTSTTPQLLQIAYNPDVTVRSRGVMEKCTYCTQRINRAKLDARLAGRELVDGELQTACQQACPTRAISFGNVLDRNSEVARLRQGNRAYEMLAELNNKPRTSYLAKIRNPNPDLEA
jgi:molybdopterin-containing oxidoreductase family iron-sulfur binding subunit